MLARYPILRKQIAFPVTASDLICPVDLEILIFFQSFPIKVSRKVAIRPTVPSQIFSHCTVRKFRKML
jgi:hypothetical protein